MHDKIHNQDKVQWWWRSRRIASRHYNIPPRREIDSTGALKKAARRWQKRKKKKTCSRQHLFSLKNFLNYCWFVISLFLTRYKYYWHNMIKQNILKSSNISKEGIVHQNKNLTNLGLEFYYSQKWTNVYEFSL